MVPHIYYISTPKTNDVISNCAEVIYQLIDSDLYCSIVHQTNFKTDTIQKPVGVWEFIIIM